jgi:uncharacterized protein (DUF1330 family)
MGAYVVFTRERTRNAAQMDQYRLRVPASFQQHPATIRAIHGRHEVLEGPAIEEIIILEFPTYARRPRLGIKVRNIRPPASIASRVGTTAASSPRANRSSVRAILGA